MKIICEKCGRNDIKIIREKYTGRIYFVCSSCGEYERIISTNSYNDIRGFQEDMINDLSSKSYDLSKG